MYIQDHNFELSANTGFLVNRYTDPAQWVKLVADFIKINKVQFTADLINPSLPADLIKKIKPHQLYAAGDLSDPHGTHRVCLSIINQALDSLKGEEFLKDCWMWLYRGAWQEWPMDQRSAAPPP